MASATPALSEAGMEGAGMTMEELAMRSMYQTKQIELDLRQVSELTKKTKQAVEKMNHDIEKEKDGLIALDEKICATQGQISTTMEQLLLSQQSESQMRAQYHSDEQRFVKYVEEQRHARAAKEERMQALIDTTEKEIQLGPHFRKEVLRSFSLKHIRSFLDDESFEETSKLRVVDNSELKDRLEQANKVNTFYQSLLQSGCGVDAEKKPCSECSKKARSFVKDWSGIVKIQWFFQLAQQFYQEMTVKDKQ